MGDKRKRKEVKSPVAKNMHKFNKAAVEPDKRQKLETLATLLETEELLLNTEESLEFEDFDLNNEEGETWKN